MIKTADHAQKDTSTDMLKHGSVLMENRKKVKNMDEYEKRDKETAELVYRIMSWIEENVDLTNDEMCTVAKIEREALEKY